MAKQLKPKVALSIQAMQAARARLQAHPTYGNEEKLICSFLKKNPINTDYLTVAAKVALIDATNSTNISRYKKDISVCDIANVIVDLAKNHNLDMLIQNGDIQAVESIANGCKIKGKNLFSFASKYCCYHNIFVYGKDDFSIYDSVLATYLPYYVNIKTGTIDNWRVNVDYDSYNQLIQNVLTAHKITIPQARRMFDHFVWINYR